MLVCRNDQDALTIWNAGVDPLHGVLYPRDAEGLWADADLNAVGLYRVQRFVAPSGKVPVGEPSFSLSGNVVIETYAVQDTPQTIPQIISDRQFFQQLAVQSVITQDEALAAVGPGTLPASLVALVNGLPVDQQFSANMLLKGAVQFDRQHPMVAVLGQAFGWNDAQLDALWTAAALL